MADYGGLGGIKKGRPRNIDDMFECAIDRALGRRMREDENAAQDVWSALANVDWKHVNGDTASYSFRAAGDLLAAVVGKGGDYMDYYCGSDYVDVADWISDAMAAIGWTHSESE